MSSFAALKPGTDPLTLNARPFMALKTHEIDIKSGAHSRRTCQGRLLRVLRGGTP